MRKRGASTKAAHSSDQIGQYNAVTVFNNQLHVFTYDATTSSLRHVWWNGSWHFETLNGPASSKGGQYNAVTVFNRQLHVFTYDPATGNLRHVWWNGSWHFETLDGPASTKAGHSDDPIGEYNAVTVFNNQLHLFAYDATTASLRHDWWNGVWHFETLDGPASTKAGHTSDAVGRFNAVTVFNGQLHLFTADSYPPYHGGPGPFTTSLSLRHDWWNGAWHFGILDRGPPCSSGYCYGKWYGYDNVVTVYL